MPIKTCKICPEEFYVKPYHLKLGYGIYCSANCQHKGRKTGKVLECFVCREKCYKSLKALRVSKSKKYFCSKSCQTKWRNSEFIGSKHANFIDGRSTYRGILSRLKIPKICTICHTKDERVVAVHHIDKNHKNNDAKNLTWLCHNCHFLVHHDKVVGDKFLSQINR